MQPPAPMRQVKSCGFIVFRSAPEGIQFLLMKHPNRYDLPKGHMESGEDEMQTALRELREETGYRQEDIEVDATFRWAETYEANYRRFNGERVKKTLVIFLAFLRDPKQPLRLTEHQGHEWLHWRPPHAIQRNTVDPLLAQVAQHFAQNNLPRM